jgi:rSAM/selenodomain-associated transferase 1
MPPLPPVDRDLIGIFAKAPISGHVKTRLAATIGPAAAAALYRGLGRKVVATAAGAAAGDAAVVWYTPLGKRAAVEEWLDGIPGVRMEAQPPGDLGRRLRYAFARHFGEGARRVVIIGTDCPGITPRILAQAFAALRTADLVLGPATDGGYYLIGLRAPRPHLFRRMAWSTNQVFRATVERARALGCSCRVLRPLRDVDTVADARALGLLKVPASRGHR